MTRLPNPPKVVWVLIDRTTGMPSLAKRTKDYLTMFAFSQETAHRYVLADPKPKKRKGKK